MRIGVLSDTHMPEQARELPLEVREAFKDVDSVLHAGDLVEAFVLEELGRLCPDVCAVQGNMDSRKLKETLSQKKVIEAGGLRIGLTHGFGPPQGIESVIEKTFETDDVDIIVYGHSHVPVTHRKGKILFVNPGSPTDAIYAPYNSFAIIDIEKKKATAKIIKIKR